MTAPPRPSQLDPQAVASAFARLPVTFFEWAACFWYSW